MESRAYDEMVISSKALLQHFAKAFDWQSGKLAR
jgi:hypothetical protein